ncbi:CHASE2 domain-containing protein [Pigmentiphaga sp. GD03639]|uniref:CHASE2 domain-containing protein n=1 Tax=unclassified Pigmentiphaga TaxID=2626614 RepID=UPI00244B7E29|nr:CHASE2 domain-containing protein [Pigmentiphaga sp. GD03639]MDH2235487.1 CHASE2 domain-containing protein [Pigmentiphaga sp. GD03639]
MDRQAASATLRPGPGRPRAAVRGISVVAGLLLAALLAWQNGLGRLDAALYDFLSRLDPAVPSQDIVVVAIDEASLAKVGRWPWSRDQQIDLIERIAQQSPAALGLDLLLSEPSADPSVDLRMAEAIRRSGNVVLPVFTADTGGRVQAMLPVPPLAAAARSLGHVSVEPDADGVVRSVFLREGTRDRQWNHFALALLQIAGRAVARPLPGNRAPAGPETAPEAWWRDFWIHIDYAGPAGTYRTVSAAQVLAGELPDGALDGRIVLVGSTAAGLGDVYPTPLSARHSFTPGVEISANVIDNLMSGTARRVIAPWAGALLTVLLVAAMLPALWLFAPGWALAASVAGIGVAAAASGAMLLAEGVWWPPGAAVLAIAAFYLGWNWRRLERAAGYLVDELGRLKRHGAVLPQDAAAPAGDLIDRRIHDLARATGRLLDVQAFMSSVIESLPEAALAVGEDGRVLLANREAVRQFGAAAAKGEEMARLLADFTLVGGGPLSWPAAVAPGHFAECRDAAGRAFLFEYARCAGEEGGETAWIATLVDINPLREAERKRDQALRFLSHDIRSPQGAILALLDLHRSDPGELPQDELLDRIRRYVLRTQALAESFVELARLATAPVRDDVFEGTDVVLDAADECWSLAQAKHIELDADVPDDGAPLRGDRAQLTRALINLIGNAIKYSPPHTRVDCRMVRREDLWCIAVRDQGRGIAAEDQARLFQEFSRVGGAADGDEPGFGLGLAFVKAVVERHGGKIECQSAPGQGSEFRLFLPATVNNTEPRASGRGGHA